jgi:hypothetical protein
MSDISDVAPLPSTPSRNDDHAEMDTTSPGGIGKSFFVNLKISVNMIDSFIQLSVKWILTRHLTMALQALFHL